ncbi:ankyrin repeat, PH and SEC7 domain containing protein secG-like isoform X1 [Oscarella lobularis]|uniref:ankyrin repeat, PH and SEC7 domain containing protein secG-like isoform X1 n=1 Tax=Oscarella lobularis TaxID=121494 RepID=UPI00331441B1
MWREGSLRRKKKPMIGSAVRLIKHKNQHIDIAPEGFDTLRPLHYACEWGSIFGVQWLVRHGAKVNLRVSRNGRTPYSFACANSVHTMEKMLYLEELGYNLSSHDIVWAASNEFLSSEKAHKIFHYLVNEKGLSVNSINNYKNTPLHLGSVFGVEWLVKHNAAINSVNKFGITPFMYACSSTVDRSKKVRYLDQKGADQGADCQANDHEGKTALFYAITNDFMCEDDKMKDVLEYLVITKGIDINSVDKGGRTPFLYEFELRFSFFVIHQLI